eukprot:TRINITY_DN4180_c0_g1_i1.p1 TRINITY_DN4180_c0_g1~~TRINITY_DN4180_c0_g1_i1.p1  ORF type:complete len:608 (+),score=130.48 TRINITY_DN4180_c0_g1_i1:196-2019(+)
MGTSHSREGDLESDFSEDEYEETKQSLSPKVQDSSPQSSTGLESRLQGLSLGNNSNVVKLYKHIGGNTPKAKWMVADKLVSYEFIRDGDDSDQSEDEDEDESKYENDDKVYNWMLKIGTKVKARVDDRLQMKFSEENLRVDFVHHGVWAIKFLNVEGYKDFVTEYKNCLFENIYCMEANEQNKIKVFGKDFIGWANPEAADDSVWEDAQENTDFAQKVADKKVAESFEEKANGGIQSVTMGAKDYSFLVSDAGIEAVKNFHRGIHGKGVSIKFESGKLGNDLIDYCTPKKGLLMKAERDMVVMSPSTSGSKPAGVHQMDIETGKIVSEWRFEKDGTDISMRDITNDTKGSQLDPSVSTFMGLDDNRLCRWDMRDKHGIVHKEDGLVLSWAEGHQFTRGTNFGCFATTGDGCVVVGSQDGKVRLYGTTSMRQAKTAFPGLGSPITHVDVTYDGRWIVATTDTYLLVISTVFTDKDGKVKTGFSGRMGNRIPAPRLLKLQPLDAYLAGENKFHGGQFSWVTESGKEERHIVASVGNFTVIWNFNQVKNSNHECYKFQEGLKTCYCYKILPKEESVIESKFMHEKFSLMNSPEAPVVVATPKKVSSFSIA